MEVAGWWIPTRRSIHQESEQGSYETESTSIYLITHILWIEACCRNSRATINAISTADQEDQAGQSVQNCFHHNSVSSLIKFKTWTDNSSKFSLLFISLKALPSSACHIWKNSYIVFQNLLT